MYRDSESRLQINFSSFPLSGLKSFEPVTKNNITKVAFKGNRNVSLCSFSSKRTVLRNFRNYSLQYFRKWYSFQFFATLVRWLVRDRIFPETREPFVVNRDTSRSIGISREEEANPWLVPIPSVDGGGSRVCGNSLRRLVKQTRAELSENDIRARAENPRLSGAGNCAQLCCAHGYKRDLTYAIFSDRTRRDRVREGSPGKVSVFLPEGTWKRTSANRNRKPTEDIRGR